MCARRLVPRSWVRFPMWQKFFSVTFILKNNNKIVAVLMRKSCLVITRWLPEVTSCHSKIAAVLMRKSLYKYFMYMGYLVCIEDEI